MYSDKFAMTPAEAMAQNEQCLTEALDALYATYVTSETVAAHRGRAIRAINAMARALGYPRVARTD